MVIGVGELRKGITIEFDGEPYQVVEYNSHKMQQRAPVVKLRLRELRTGRTMDKTYNGYNVQLTLARVENRAAQYIYDDGDLYYFMDTESYEQYGLARDQLGNALSFLKEQMEVELIFFRDQPISVELPTYTELAVVDTPPPLRGNTAQGSTKPATLETGIVVNVPFFVNNGDKVRVDTRTGEYLERVT